MIRINLLPEELRVKEARKFELPPFVSPKGLLYFLAGLAFIELLMVAHLVFVANPHFDRLQKGYLSLGGPLTEVREINAQTSAIQEVNRSLLRWMDPPLSWTAIMSSLVNGMEKGVWLTQLKIERRDFDVAEAPESALSASKIAKSIKSMVGKPSAPAKPSPTPRPVVRRPVAKEKRIVLVLRGRVSVDREEAAVVGRFLQQLKSQPVLANLVDDFTLDQIRRDVSSEVPVFDFVVLGVVKRDLEKEFYNLS